jgi:hypothetical protein
MHDSQICSVADLHSVVAMVLLTHSKAIKIACDMIRSACIIVPVWIYLVRSSHHSSRWSILLVRIIMAVPALDRCMPHFATDLTLWTFVVVVAVRRSTTTTSASQLPSITMTRATRVRSATASTTASSGYISASTTTPSKVTEVPTCRRVAAWC